MDRSEYLPLSELRRQLKEIVIGQDELVDVVTLSLYKHIVRLWSNNRRVIDTPTSLLVIGGSGTGKTFCVKEAARLANIPFIYLDGTRITREGWSGTSFSKHMVRELGEKAGNSGYTSCPIVFIDEFDKFCRPQFTSGGDNSAMSEQASILTYLEGAFVDGGALPFHTSSCCFIFAGAFTELFTDQDKTQIGFNAPTEENTSKVIDDKLEEKLTEFGVMPEILGRISRTIITKPVSPEMFRNLLCSENYICNQWFSFMRSKGANRDKEPNYSEIIDKAMKKKLGVRGLTQLMTEEVDQVLEKNMDLLLKK